MTILDEAERAIRSARSKGAVGPSAIVPRIIPKLLANSKHTNHLILDYGCGKDMIHVLKLQKQGYQVIGYDISLPDTARFLENKYDIIYLSNVLNVQSSEDMLHQLLDTVWKCLKVYGFVVANYPASPRYLEWDDLDMQEWLFLKCCNRVERVGYELAGNNIVWVMR